MAQLTKKYIHEHKNAVHTYESFGRAIVEQILNAASEQAGDKGIEKANIEAKFTVEAYEPAACVQVCATVQGVTVCYHVG